jgi:hypothetical protein
MANRQSIPPDRLYRRLMACPKNMVAKRIRTRSTKKASFAEYFHRTTSVIILESPSLMPGIGTMGGRALSTAYSASAMAASRESVVSFLVVTGGFIKISVFS